ncbi:hypothetical protein [Alloactinosynnema sp. L-07]|uniref:hypothetical protein n=1 Tax=Alloactinosynnema sp. L-07 TaxID=1653480 RepID=UPI00065EF6F5|nr:hypothetical protein [Alloactinosynnema sp. L-07]CRK59044.1 hypothetical protein [Alloactinosynnema sp. L-07]
MSTATANPKEAGRYEPLQVTDFDGMRRGDERLNEVDGTHCPTCYRNGSLVVTRETCIWPCRRHQTRLPRLHGNHTLSPARARPAKGTR